MAFRILPWGNHTLPMLIVFTLVQGCRWDYETSLSAQSSQIGEAGAQSGGTGPNNLGAAGVSNASAGRSPSGTAAGSAGKSSVTTAITGGATSLNGGATSLNGGATSLNGGATSLNGGATSLNGGATGRTVVAGATTVAQAGATSVGVVALQGVNQTGRYGGTTTTPHLDVCPGNQALIGIQGTFDDAGVTLISSIQGICGSLVLSSDGSTVTTSMASQLPLRGGTGTAFTQSCPVNQVVIGFEGKAGSALDSVAIRCGAITHSSTGFRVTVGTTLPVVGGTGGQAFSDGCSTGQIARALNLVVYEGHWIDAMGLGCGALTLVNL